MNDSLILARGANAVMVSGPDPDPRKPRIQFPADACDCHAHVFGEPGQFPYTADAAYRFPTVMLDDFERMLGIIGCSRGVLVQPSVYGTDNSCMELVLRQRPNTLRGVAVVDPDVSDAELQRLHTVGVRGIRINTASPTDGLRLEHAPKLAERIRPLGWHLQFFPNLTKMPEIVQGVAALSVPCVIDHFGHVAASGGTQSDGFKRLLELARMDHVWFKLMGPYRVSTLTPHFPDVVPMAQQLIAAAPDRCVWATDWPHPNSSPVPNDGELADQLASWAPDAEVMKRILVDNPARLYGFGKAEGAKG